MFDYLTNETRIKERAAGGFTMVCPTEDRLAVVTGFDCLLEPNILFDLNPRFRVWLKADLHQATANLVDQIWDFSEELIERLQEQGIGLHTQEYSRLSAQKDVLKKWFTHRRPVTGETSDFHVAVKLADGSKLLVTFEESSLKISFSKPTFAIMHDVGYVLLDTLAFDLGAHNTRQLKRALDAALLPVKPDDDRLALGKPQSPSPV